MRARFALVLPLLAVAACDGIATAPAAPEAPAATPAAASAPIRTAAPVLTASAAPSRAPLSRPAAARPEAYNQATAEERAAAVAPVTQARKLGTTIASLGNPTEQGFWIKTPLVSASGKGRLVDPASGKSVNVDLLPLSGPESGGSQVSLAALQMLGVSLTGLPKLEVYAQ